MMFFILQNLKTDEGSTITDFIPVDGSPTGKAPCCPVCGKFLGMLPLASPVRVELEVCGAKCGDIAFGPANELLVSERFWGLYQDAGLTGLNNAGPAEVVKIKTSMKMLQSTVSYRCCQVVYGRAAIDEVKSDLERERPWTCAECRQGGIIKRAKRIILEAESWSGEDIFFARGLPGTILTSEAFREFWKNIDAVNGVLIPAEKFSFDHYPWEKEMSLASEHITLYNRNNHT